MHKKRAILWRSHLGSCVRGWGNDQKLWLATGSAWEPVRVPSFKEAQENCRFSCLAFASSASLGLMQWSLCHRSVEGCTGLKALWGRGPHPCLVAAMPCSPGQILSQGRHSFQQFQMYFWTLVKNLQKFHMKKYRDTVSHIKPCVYNVYSIRKVFNLGTTQVTFTPWIWTPWTEFLEFYNGHVFVPVKNINLSLHNNKGRKSPAKYGVTDTNEIPFSTFLSVMPPP